MADNNLTDSELETVFRAGREATPEPAPDWLARVTADAEAEAQRRARLASAAAGPGFGAQLFALLGGWRGLGGMVAACATGLVIGISPPEALDGALTLAFGGSSTFDLVPNGELILFDDLVEG